MYLCLHLSGSVAVFIPLPILMCISGTQCEEMVDLCDSQPCVGGGFCMSEPGSFTCTCPPNRAGQYCERQQNCVGGESVLTFTHLLMTASKT